MRFSCVVQDLSCSQNPTMSLVSMLSKKASQLITTLDPSCRKPRPRLDSSAELSQVDIAADVMTSSRSLINWLDRNSTNLVLDYNEFRQTILKDALELSTIPVRYTCTCAHSRAHSSHSLTHSSLTHPPTHSYTLPHSLTHRTHSLTHSLPPSSPIHSTSLSLFQQLTEFDNQKMLEAVSLSSNSIIIHVHVQVHVLRTHDV